jgi:hypothetical protein
MLEKMLQRVEELKVILAVSHRWLRLEQIGSVLDPFTNFVRVLQTSALFTEENKGVFTNPLNCISVVVVKAEKGSAHYMEEVIKGYTIPFLEREESKGTSAERKLVLKLLKSVY